MIAKALTFLVVILMGSFAMAEEEPRVLFDFAKPESAEEWTTVNDGVMGGVSEGEFKITDQKTLEFFGVLSLENNGGFASVRTKPRKLGLEKDDVFVVRLKGDGRIYSMNLYVPTRFVAFSYRAMIETKKDKWIEIKLPLDEFEATRFGRKVSNADPVAPSEVDALGFLLGDKKAEPFQLEVDWIKVVKKETSNTKSSASDRLPPAAEGKAWKLIWHDEFDGTELDASKWEVPDNRRRGGWWSPKAVSLDGKGNLVIRTFKEGGTYYDACVRTRGKFEHAFGYYVARIRLQEEPGHWSAFWLYNSSVGKVGDEGRNGTEIDIMEKPWLDDRVQHALHWDGYGKDHKSEGKVVEVPGVMEGYHTFSLLWTEDEYVFYIDGKETWRTDAGGVCQVPLYIKLSDEIGDWAGDIADAKLPDRFLVDYVRVYDLVDAGEDP